MTTTPTSIQATPTSAATSFPEARSALLLPVCINLLNYIDRYGP